MPGRLFQVGTPNPWEYIMPRFIWASVCPCSINDRNSLRAGSRSSTISAARLSRSEGFSITSRNSSLSLKVVKRGSVGLPIGQKRLPTSLMPHCGSCEGNREWSRRLGLNHRPRVYECVFDILLRLIPPPSSQLQPRFLLIWKFGWNRPE